MNNLAITYQQIADILSFDVSEIELREALMSSDFNWEAIVAEGSKHYVIPAIYCRLKTKGLLNLLPNDLINYLEYITNENRLRNEIILKQINSISILLNKNKISHVFLKGAALLTMGYFEDIAERMLGDIDLLVAPHQIYEAQKLLCEDDYVPSQQTLGDDFFEHKHLPRLETKITETRIAAVEVHQRLFKTYDCKELSLDAILTNKVQKNNVFGPSEKHLLMHNILNFQINDFGRLFHSISFRSAYDTVIIQNSYSGFNDWYNIQPFKNYFRYTSLFFKEIKQNTNSRQNALTSFYIFKLRHVSFYKTWNTFIKIGRLIPIFFNRIWLFVSKHSYRRAIIKDRNRIYHHFKSILNNF